MIEEEEHRLLARLREQVSELEHQLTTAPPGPEKKSALTRARSVVAFVNYTMSLAQPLPIGAGGNTVTIVCPHCSNQVKVTLSK